VTIISDLAYMVFCQNKTAVLTVEESENEGYEGEDADVDIEDGKDPISGKVTGLL
jgi:hypothetical protein